MKRSTLLLPAILLLLLSFIFLPRMLLGFQNEKNARQALLVGEQAYAAQQFELAAQRLFWRPELWNEAGFFYSETGDVGKMLVAYQAARERKSLSSCGWLLLGAFNAEPVVIWQEGLIYYPDNPLLYVGIAARYRMLADYDLEREYLLDALLYEENSPNCSSKVNTSFGYTHYRAGLLMMQDDPSSALDELNTASLLNPEYAPVVETLRTSLNLAALEHDPAEKLILLGRGLGLAGEWQLAASAFDNATQAYPENASAWAWLGEAKQHLGEDALPALDQALSLAPDSTLIHSLCGLYWQRQGDLDAALDEFQQAADLEPENPAWQAALGELYARSGDLPPALAAYQQATALASDDPTYWNLLALFSVQYRIDMAQVGLDAARQALILRPNNAVYVDTLGWVYFGLEQDEAAEEQFLHALDLDPNLAVAHLHLGMFYVKRGYREKAYSYFLQAKELSQDDFVGKQATQFLEQYFQE